MDETRTVVELTADERALLAEVLEQDFRDLKQEIGSTEDWEYREGLKARREMLRTILNKLGAAPA